MDLPETEKNLEIDLITDSNSELHKHDFFKMLNLHVLSDNIAVSFGNIVSRQSRSVK